MLCRHESESFMIVVESYVYGNWVSFQLKKVKWILDELSLVTKLSAQSHVTTKLSDLDGKGVCVCDW